MLVSRPFEAILASPPHADRRGELRPSAGQGEHLLVPGVQRRNRSPLESRVAGLRVYDGPTQGGVAEGGWIQSPDAAHGTAIDADIDPPGATTIGIYSCSLSS